MWDCQNAKALNVPLGTKIFSLFRDKEPSLEVAQPKTHQKTCSQNTKVEAAIPIKVDQKAKSAVSRMNGLHVQYPSC